MNIAFIALFYRTIFFKKIADELEKSGHNLFWITTSPKWKKWLINDGVAEEKILFINKLKSKNIVINDIDIQHLNNIEKQTKTSIKSIYYMDRIIRFWKWDKTAKYVIYVVKEIEKFLKDKNIKLVIGEPAALHEIITALICEYLNITFLFPFTIRIPSSRFAFFKGYLQKDFVEFKSYNDTEILNEAIDVRNSIIVNKEKPNYWHINNKIPKINSTFIRNIIHKIIEINKECKYNANVKSFKHHLIYEKKYLKPVNYLSVKFFKTFEKPRLNEKYILFTLHKQPELSIDVLGVMYNNQIELIKNISKQLPFDIKLYVKEHSNSLGDRTIFQLNKIKNIPGVRLIDPFSDINELIKNSQLVITVSGTVAYEAGLYGKKAITLSPMYFNKLSTVKYLSNINDISKYIYNDSLVFNEEDDLKALSYFLENSFEGLIGDPINYPFCMSQQNINKVTKAFNKVINKIQEYDF